MSGSPARSHGSLISVIGLCLIGVALRAPGIYAHLPNVYWHDELNFVEGALRVGAGELVAAGFGGYAHGTMTYYTLFAAFAAYFMAGRLVGVFDSPDDLLLSYVSDPSALFLIARTVMLGTSVVTIVLTFSLTRQLFNARAGYVSAGLMAVSFQAVQIAIGKEDSFYALLVLATVWLAVRMVDAQYVRWQLFALGALGGAATAVKYFGVLLLPLVAMVGDLSQIRSGFGGFCKRTAAGTAIFAATFLCLVPGVLLDTERFLISFRDLATTNTATLFTDRAIAVSPWYGYLWHSVAVASGPLAAALCYVAAGWMALTRPRDAAVLFAYPVLLVALLTASLLFGRPAEALNFYQISALPLLFVAAGGLVGHLWTSRRRVVRVAIAATLVSIVVTNLLDDIRFQRLLQLQDSRTVVRQWIEEHVPAGTTILVEGAIGTFVFEGPQLMETEASLVRTLDEIRQQGGGGGLWSAKIRVAREAGPQGRFDVHKVRDLTDDLLEGAPPYVVVKDDRGRRLVEADGRYRAAFSAEADSPRLFLFVPMLSSADIARLRRIPLLADDPKLIPGPDIRVYRLAAGRVASIGAQ